MWNNPVPLCWPVGSLAYKYVVLFGPISFLAHMWIQWEAETLGYLKTMCPQAMRAKIDHMIEKFLVQRRISKTVKNEWTLRNSNALNNCIFRARKCPGVGRVLGECFCSWLCLSVFAAETPRGDSGNEPASPENTVYAQVTHPDTVSPFSLILHPEHYCYIMIQKLVATVIWLSQTMYTIEERRRLPRATKFYADPFQPQPLWPQWNVYSHP